jgi:hypothetical protein
MYLLDFLCHRLDADKLAMARQLMYKAWAGNSDLLAGHVPDRLLARLAKMQQYCGAIVVPCVAPDTAPGRILGLRLRTLAMSAYVVVGTRRVLPDQTHAVQMHEDFVTQAIEDLADEGLSFQALPGRYKAAFVALYALASCCFWCLAGVLEPADSGSSYRRVPSDAIEEALRLYWFGHHMSFHSTFADMRLRELVLDELQSSGEPLAHAVKRRAPAFRCFVTNTLDKYVSFHEDFSIHIDAKDKGRYNAMYRKAELICYLYLMSHKDSVSLSSADKSFAFNTAYPHDYDLAAVYEAGFADSELASLLEDSESRLEGEACIVRSGPAAFRMGLINLKYAIGIYLKPMLAAMGTRGDWFDKRYVHPYLIQRATDGRFRFGPEVKPRSNNEGTYDIDLLVADEQLGRLYFCQIKHRVATLLPHFRDEFDEYSRNKQLQHAVDQLLDTKPQFSNPGFVDKLRRSLRKARASPAFVAKVDSEFLQAHVGFIVVHTIENLDFATKEGVALYEWNTFRNLLRGKITVMNEEGFSVTSPDLHDVALDDPNRLSRALMAWSATQGDDNLLHPDRQWSYAANSYLRLCETWDITLWNRRVGWSRRASLNFPVF